MAIAFDAASNGNTTGTTLTISHTCTGSNRLLVVGIDCGTDTITGVTYNGVALTLAKKQLAGLGTQASYLYYLIAPSTGANNIVISETTGVIPLYGMNASYTGVSQTAPIDATSGSTVEGSASLTTSVTTVQNNCWAIITCDVDGAVLSAGTNVTIRANGDATPRRSLGDSNSPITPAGLYSQTWTRSSNGRITTAQISITPPFTIAGGGNPSYSFFL